VCVSLHLQNMSASSRRLCLRLAFLCSRCCHYFLHLLSIGTGRMDRVLACIPSACLFYIHAPVFLYYVSTCAFPGLPPALLHARLLVLLPLSPRVFLTCTFAALCCFNPIFSAGHLPATRARRGCGTPGGIAVAFELVGGIKKTFAHARVCSWRRLRGGVEHPLSLPPPSLTRVCLHSHSLLVARIGACCRALLPHRRIVSQRDLLCRTRGMCACASLRPSASFL